MAVGLNETTHSEALEASYAAWEDMYRGMLAERKPPSYGEYEPVRIGPTWQWDDGWVLPECSLGWGVLAWCSHWLKDKDGGPWVFTPEQARFVLWYFAVDKHSGRVQNDSAVLQRLKGWGKDPLAATLSLAFLCGPVKFSHFDADGKPVGKDDDTAWIQVVAVSQTQTANTLKVFPWIITERFKAEYRVVIQKTSIYALGNRQIQAVTASPLALEGGRPTFIVAGESQNWNASNGGTEMYGVLEGNSAKSEGGQARMLFICNAYRPGEESVGERIRLAWEDTQGDDAEFESFGLMYDSLEAPPHAPLELDAVEDVIKAVRGDAVWLDPERIANSIKNQTNTVSESRRKWYNQILAVADAWVDPADWRMCGRKRDLVPGEKIVLFFDGSKSGDHTGLVGCCIEDGYVFLGGVWEPQKIGKDLWRVDREAVDIRVSELVDEFKVLGIWGDPSDARDDETGERYWEPYFDMWHKRWGRKFRLWAQRSGNYMHSVNWDMRSPERLKRFIEAAELFTTDVASHNLPHDASPLLARHVGNARRRPDPRFGIGLSKATKDSDKKIDLAVCAVGARMMRREALMDPRIRTGGSQGKSRTHIMR